ncbi:hypothetical protein B5P44_13895 [Mycobacterium sp. CBMA 213]|nr:hypothetical protein [Mycolicibacterium sp. CBMA 213]
MVQGRRQISGGHQPATVVEVEHVVVANYSERGVVRGGDQPCRLGQRKSVLRAPMGRSLGRWPILP